MCSLQRVTAYCGDPLREQRRRDRRRGRRSPPPPRCVPRLVAMRGGSTACTAVSRRNVTPCASCQPARQGGNRVAALDAELVRAVQHRRRTRRRPSIGKRWPALAAVSSAQPSPISRRHEGLQHGPRLRPPRHHGEAAMQDRDAGRPARPRARRRASAWRAARSRRAAWPVTVTKPKLRIEAPFACASRSMTTTRLSAPRGRQRMRQAADAGADDGYVDRPGGSGMREGQRRRQACARISRRRVSSV